MITYQLLLDKRRKLACGEYPLKFQFGNYEKTAYLSVGISLPEEKWSKEAMSVIGCDLDTMRTNTYLHGQCAKIGEIIQQLRMNPETARWSAIEVKNHIDEVLNGKYEECGAFLKRFNLFIECCQSKRTKALYSLTLSKIKKFEPKINRLSFEQISKDWLRRFDVWMAEEGNHSRNGRNIHLRNIRAVFNDAIDNEITTAYPFRKFKIKSEATVHRALSVEDLRAYLFESMPEPYQVRHLDMFKLIFLLCGINIVDLCNLKEIDNGRIHYNRAKTGKLYSIKVEPEAEEIINKYRGKEQLLDMLDTNVDYHNYARRMNDALQNVCAKPVVRKGHGGKKTREPMFPAITSYWARHTWATIAASLDIPKETISAALGHSIGSAITSIYIDFDTKKVDEANRRVIDWVFYGKK